MDYLNIGDTVLCDNAGPIEWEVVGVDWAGQKLWVRSPGGAYVTMSVKNARLKQETVEVTLDENVAKRLINILQEKLQYPGVSSDHTHLLNALVVAVSPKES